MVRCYDTFLIRHWVLERGLERIEVTHIQSGERALLATLAEATAWMKARADATEHDITRQPARGPPAWASGNRAFPRDRK